MNQPTLCIVNPEARHLAGGVAALVQDLEILDPHLADLGKRHAKLQGPLAQLLDGGEEIGNVGLWHAALVLAEVGKLDHRDLP